ncbi:T9SS type A sorting domain-containing protein [Fibrobacter sp. UBA4297]|uniref:T9SS type A sorting domain-containing protein n=1 Tax=Fibrobacter sp. UBA4297 TaxID=1946536 RepID=UPI0025C5AADD|nr:T9SS type A sorting domain-containing protein [Fibrobacter sp. UBA4297]
MNYIIRLLLAASLILPVSVWAQGVAPKQYLNLYYRNDQLYVGQYKFSCEIGKKDNDRGDCVFSHGITSEYKVRTAFYAATVTSKKWVLKDAETDQKQSTVLNLATDINFGQVLDEEGKCSENHNFLPFVGATFNGQNHTISNICRVFNGTMNTYAGFFGVVDGKEINDLNITNVNFIVDKYTEGNAASANGSDYWAAGAFAAEIWNSKVTNVTLKKIFIQAPLAGGLAGFIANSTISDVKTADNAVVKILNESQITQDYAGKKISGVNSVVFSPYKVSLGGLAGVAFYTDIKDVDIAVQVENKVAVDQSVLGGLVGHYVYAPTNQVFGGITPKNSVVQNIQIHGATGDDSKLVVSGGVAMGGVFGATKRYEIYASEVYGLEVDKVAVTGLNIAQSMALVDDATVAKPMYFGGVIGNADLCNGGILKITDAKVNELKIDEYLPYDGAFQYFVGGIAGFAACENVNNSGNREDLYLTLKNSKASGRIILQGGNSVDAEMSYARASAMMGGLVGDAIVSLENNSTAGNESEVSLTYAAKRAAGVTDADSVIVGGVFGAVSKYNNEIKKVRLSDLAYKSSIYVVDDGITSRIGGIIGKYPLVLSGEPKIDFEDVHVDFRGGSVVSYSGEAVPSENTSSSIGGICGICRTPELIARSSVEGSFSGTLGFNTPPKKNFYVGGLVGEADFHGSEEVVVKNNYYIGTIADKFNRGKGHAGYLFGYMHGDGLGNKPVLTSNYHYGADNVGAVGYFENYGAFTDIVFFNENGFNKFVAKHNVRNGGGGLQDGPNGSTNNGYAISIYMQSQDFADFLNSVWTDPENQVWAYENDLPTLINPVVAGSSSSNNGSSSSYEGSSSSDVTSSSDGLSSSSANNGDSSSSYEESSSSNATSSSSDGTSSSSNVTSSSDGLSSSSANDGDSSSSYGESSSSNGTSSSSNGTSSSSDATSSSSNGASSSSGNENSSSSEKGKSSSSNGEMSSSSAGNDKYSSSSSAKDESSSSKGGSSNYNYIYELAEPTARQDGSALRMTLGDTIADKLENVDYHIVVKSDAGTYLDTVVDGKTVGDVKNGTWRLDPAPAGEYTVTFTLTDGKDSVSYDKKFITEKEKTFTPQAWQTLSLYAFCRDKGGDCMSELDARFARQQQNWAAEQCEEMKAQVKRGAAPDDDHFYHEMEDICAQANGLDATASVYWWDELNPVGEFWQYRKFSVNDKFDSTRGYWYGPIDNEPLVMSLETPDMKDEVVWRLENKYSGWNLVANPFGWYVSLPKEKGLQFCKWDSEASTYVEADTLGPYEAIWVHTEKAMTYRIPLKAAIVLEGEKKSLNKSSASENWNLRVVLADDNGKRDSWNELAVGTASSLGEPPAGMGDRVNLSIVEGKKRLVKSVKKNADDLEWNLEVSASTSRDGHLSFDGLESVWAKGMRVYATVDGNTVEVAKESPVDVRLSSKAKNISVRVTKSAVLTAIAKNMLSRFRVNQTPNVLNVGFDAASKLAGMNVKVSVVGVDGRIVATNRAIAREGSNAISMKKPKQGVYFVRLKVGSQSAVTRVMVR